MSHFEWIIYEPFLVSAFLFPLIWQTWSKKTKSARISTSFYVNNPFSCWFRPFWPWRISKNQMDVSKKLLLSHKYDAQVLMQLKNHSSFWKKFKNIFAQSVDQWSASNLHSWFKTARPQPTHFSPSRPLANSFFIQTLLENFFPDRHLF